MWYIVQVLFVVSALIGAAVISASLWIILAEARRAGKQAGRLATIQARAKGRRTATWTEWWHYFENDFAAPYHELVVGPYRLNRDTSIKIKRAFKHNGDRYTN